MKITIGTTVILLIVGFLLFSFETNSRVVLAKGQAKQMENKEYKKYTVEELAKKYDSKAIQELYQKIKYAYMGQNINEVVTLSDKLIKMAPELYLGYDAKSSVLYEYAFVDNNPIETTYKTALECTDTAIKYAPSDMNYSNLYNRKANLYYQLVFVGYKT